jgi:hypothetical protein
MSTAKIKAAWLKWMALIEDLDETTDYISVKLAEKPSRRETLFSPLGAETSVTLGDVLNMLNPKAWLSESMINTIGFLSTPSNALFIDSQHFELLTDPPTLEAKNTQLRFFRHKLDIMERMGIQLRGLLIPHNIRRTHWNAYIVTISRDLKGTIWEFEPQSQETHGILLDQVPAPFYQILLHLLPAVKFEPRARRIGNEPLKHQQDGSACGVYVSRLFQDLTHDNAARWYDDLIRETKTFEFSKRTVFSEMVKDARVQVVVNFAMAMLENLANKPRFERLQMVEKEAEEDLFAQLRTEALHKKEDVDYFTTLYERALVLGKKPSELETKLSIEDRILFQQAIREAKSLKQSLHFLPEETRFQAAAFKFGSIYDRPLP